MSAPTEEQALAFAKYHAEHAAHGGAGREFHLRAETFLLELARVSAERDSLNGKLSLIEDGDWPGQVKALRTERDAMKAQLDLAAENAQKAGGICGLCLDSILGQPDRIVAAEAERDAAVKEKLAALAKVKALHQKIADAYRLMKAARDDGCVWPATWHGCGTGRDCNCRPMRELAKKARDALASEVPPPLDDRERQLVETGSDRVTACDSCGKTARRPWFRHAPRGWLFLRAFIKASRPPEDYVVMAVCSERCARAIWHDGPGPRLDEPTTQPTTRVALTTPTDKEKTR